MSVTELKKAGGSTCVGSGRLAYLDALRGLAILLVIFAHYLPARVLDGEIGGVVATWGRGGVILFFLLSGYLVFRNRLQQTAPVFLGRRLCKIFPAYWGNVLSIACLAFLLPSLTDHYSPFAYVANFFMLSDVLKTASISGVYWTLLIEIKFYLLMALPFAFIQTGRVRWILVVTLLMNLAVWWWRGYASLLLTFIPCFFVGIEIYLAERDGWGWRPIWRLIAITSVVSLSVFLFDDIYKVVTMLYIFGGTALFAVFMKFNLANRLWVFFGNISYSHYLYHTSVGYLLFNWIGVQGSLSANLLTVFGVSGATTIVAYLSYRWIELPCVLLGKRYESLWVRPNIGLEHN